MFCEYKYINNKKFNNPLQEVMHTIGREVKNEPDYLEWVYINKKPYLYYEIIDSGTSMATFINGLISLENYKHYYIEYFGPYSGTENGIDTITPIQEDIIMSENLKKEEGTEIYSFLKNRLSIEEDGKILLVIK